MEQQVWSGLSARQSIVRLSRRNTTLRWGIPLIGVRRPARKLEYVLSRIDISIMRDTTLATSPVSYPQCTQSTRSRPLQAGRASYAGERFANWHTKPSKPTGFVLQLGSGHVPTRIIGRFGKTGFDQLGTRDIAHIEKRRPLHNLSGDLMRPVFSNMFNLGLQGRYPLFFAGTLGFCQLLGIRARDVFAAMFDAIGAGNLVFEAQVDANGIKRQLKLGGIRSLALERDIPTATSILDKTAGLDLTLDFTREPQSKDATEITHCVFNELDGSGFEGYPAQRFLAATPLETPLAKLLARLGVLKTNLVDGIAVQAEQSTRSRTKAGEIIAREPLSISAPTVQDKK